ncbi:MAG: Ni/Fe hydrogenase subunit alpha [Nitrospirae bacterium]|nr:Ni/Fe hydrogenase subunit alpha [Magnetococcales bacterium]HAT50523.1 hypothetical protein [Alphaproteobacteria bacterium]
MPRHVTPPGQPGTQPRKITIDPLTRLEGHARVEVDINGPTAHETQARFQVMEFRGWETFTKGMPVEELPAFMARICGTCSVAHHMASVRTVDKIFGLTPPPAAQLQRRALHMAGFIHSHAVHLFALAGPDLFLQRPEGGAIALSQRHLLRLLEEAPGVAGDALKLRERAAKFLTILGGRSIHPVTCVPGGMAAPVLPEKKEELIKLAETCRSLALSLAQRMELVLQHPPPHLDDPVEETPYLGLTDGGHFELFQGNLRLRSSLKRDEDVDFPHEEGWRGRIFEQVLAHSMAKEVYFRPREGEKVFYRVGPLARINCCDEVDTPEAGVRLKAFKEANQLCHRTVLYHHARLIELIYAAEKLQSLVHSGQFFGDEVRQPAINRTVENRTASAIVEAPRGVLIHDYTVDGAGLVTHMNLVVATQHNLWAINETIKSSVLRHLDDPDEVLLDAVEFGVRCYDPCLSCATHRLGEMKMEMVVRRDGKVIRQIRR